MHDFFLFKEKYIIVFKSFKFFLIFQLFEKLGMLHLGRGLALAGDGLALAGDAGGGLAGAVFAGFSRLWPVVYPILLPVALRLFEP